MTGPWSCPCLGPARGTQSTGQVVESAIGGSALQVIAGRRHHGASAVSGGVARYVGRESGPSPAPSVSLPDSGPPGPSHRCGIGTAATVLMSHRYGQT
jgi:hypothetical protein